MKCIKKKLKTPVILFLFIFCLLFTSCSSTKIASKELTPEEVSYLKRLNQYYDESSGGYQEIINQSNYDSDALYFTYYSMATLNRIDKVAFEKCRSDIEAWHRSIDINTMLSDDNYDVIDNIYYYFKLAELMNLQIEKDKRTEILAYLNKTQQIHGYFYISNIQEKEDLSKAEKSTDARVMLTTLQAIELLANDNEINMSKVKIWLDEIGTQIINEKNDIKKLNYLNAYFKANKILQIPVSEDINQIAKSVINTFKETMVNYKNVTTNIYLINSIYELDNYINDNVNNQEYISKYSKILIENKSIINEEFHILFYYYITIPYEKQNVPLPNNKAIVNNILKRKIPGSYFTSSPNEGINIVITYYAFKVLEVMGQPFDVDVFLRNAGKDIESKSTLEKICYLDILTKYGDDTNKSNKLRESLYIEANKVDFESPDKFINYTLLLNLIEATKGNRIKIPKELTDRIISYAEKTRSINDEINIVEESNIVMFISECIDIKMLRLLKPYSKTIELKEKTIINTINKYYDSLDQNVNLYLLYWAISALYENENVMDDIIIDRKSVYDDIQNRRINGLYDITGNSSANMESQYIALFLLKEL